MTRDDSRLDRLDPFPEWKTRRYRLRRLMLSDAPALLAIFGDDHVVRFLDSDRPFTNIEQAKMLVQRLDGRYDERSGIRWGVARLEDDRVIATCGLVGLWPSQRCGEVGYDVARAYWRQGVMEEALYSVLVFAFEILRLSRVQAQVMPQNIASAQLLLKLGFTKEAYRRQAGYWRGRFQDLLMFSTLLDDFSQLHSQEYV